MVLCTAIDGLRVACVWAGVATGSGAEALSLSDELLRLPGGRCQPIMLPIVAYDPIVAYNSSTRKDKQSCSVHNAHGLCFCILSFVEILCVNSFCVH